MDNETQETNNVVRKVKFSLIKKIIYSLLFWLILFTFILWISSEKIVKKRVLESVKLPLKQIVNHAGEMIEEYFARIEYVGQKTAEFTKFLLKNKSSKLSIKQFEKNYSVDNGMIKNVFAKDNLSGFLIKKTDNKKLSTEQKDIVLKTDRFFFEYAKTMMPGINTIYFYSINGIVSVYDTKGFSISNSKKTDEIESLMDETNWKNKQRGMWLKPYRQLPSHKLISRYVLPIFINDEFIGIVGFEIDLNKIYENLLNIKVFKSNKFFIFDTNNNVIVKNRDLKNLSNRMKKNTSSNNLRILNNKLKLAVKKLKKDKIAFLNFRLQDNKEYFLFVRKVNFLDWYITGVVSEDAINNLLAKLKTKFLKTGLGFLILILSAIIILLYIFIIRPIRILTNVSKKIELGDFSARANLNTRDEIGELSDAFDEMTSKLENTLENLQSDLIKREKTEQALKESNERFKKVFDNSPYMVALSLKSNGKLVDINFSFENMTGYKKEEVIGQLTIEKSLWISASRRSDMIEIIEQNGFVKDFDFLLKRKDGEIRHCLISAEQITLNGEWHLVSIIRDITEEEEAKKEKKLLEEKLEHSKKMEIIGTLAGGVAHDLNNILSGLVGYPELLLMKISKNDPMRKSLLTIKESGHKAAAIVQDLLALTRRGITTKIVLNLNDLIEDYLSSLEFKKLHSFHPEIIIEKKLKTNLYNIIGSKTHLTKIIINLVSNAVESMENGGKIIISTRNQYIDKDIKKYEVIKEGNYSIMEILDEGTGISESDIDRIFEPFYTKKKMGKSGTGLGMAVVWGAVKDHGGFIDIESKEGEGTIVSIYFPITNKELSRPDEGFDVNNYSGNGESILIVDDIASQRELAFEILNRINYKAYIAKSGEDAIEFLKEKDADLVLLDMIMENGMDGLDTYREILKIKPNQAAIIVSGYSESDRVSEAIKLGVLKYIRKPYSVEKLAKAINNIFKKI